VNEKNSIAQSITKVKAVDRINQNSERSTAAPLIPFNPVPNPHGHADLELQGRLPQRPHIDISQYFAVVPDHQHPKPQFPVVNFLPASRTTPNTENEGPSSQMSSSINTLTTGTLKRKAPSADQPSTRKKRTCQKCGQSGCSGSNNRRFCKNPCQDCGLCSCTGRNSQHPTKDCTEGWKFHHKKLKL
jgi:hypothetical protein